MSVNSVILQILLDTTKKEINRTFKMKKHIIFKECFFSVQ